MALVTLNAASRDLEHSRIFLFAKFGPVPLVLYNYFRGAKYYFINVLRYLLDMIF